MSEGSSNDSFWAELKERRVVRVAVLYAVVGWAVFNGAATLAEVFTTLPAWTAQLVLVLVILGFPVALVLAWAFQVTSGGLARAAPIISDEGHPFVAGLALGIISVSAVAFVFSSTSDGAPLAGDVELDSDLVAIVPFRFSGPPDLDYFGEAVVDLLAARFTGEVGPRAIDPAGSVAAWQEFSASDPTGAGLSAAARLGAGLLISGSIVTDPSGLTVNAVMRNVADGTDAAVAEARGPAESITLVLDRLAAELLSVNAGEYAESLDQLTSADPEAMREYLLGQQAWRAWQFEASTHHFLRAVEIDSTFALAAIGAADASSNAPTVGAPGMLALAWRHRDRLSERDRLYLRARLGPRYPDLSTRAERVQAFRDAIALAPDRAQMWYFLGDEYYHYRQGLDDDQSVTSETYFRKALQLDPRHGAAATHLLQVYVQRGDLEAVDQIWDLLASLDTTAQAQAQARLWRTQSAADTTGYGDAFADVLVSEDLWTLGEAMWPAHSMALARDTFLVSRAVVAAERVLRLPLTGLENSNGHLWVYRLYQLIGRPQRASEVLDRLEATDPDYAGGARLRLLDGTFGELPANAGPEGAAEIARRLEALSPDAYDAGTLTDLIGLQLYRFERGDLSSIPAAIETLRIAETRFPEAQSMAWETAATLFETAMLESMGNEESALEALARMDALFVQGPPFQGVMTQQAMLFVIAELAERLGDPRMALSVLDREMINFNSGDVFEARFARERGRLAALTGDTERAMAEYRYYLTVRYDPEPELEAEVEQVRRALAELTGS